MPSFADSFNEAYPILANDIFAFCRALNFDPTWQQEQLLGCVQRGDRRIACRSGKGPGKTGCSSVVGLWRTFRRYKALTILTSPTMRQCTNVWLAEARRRLEKADSWLQKFIKITKTKVEIAEDPDWSIQAVTATAVTNAQGYHHPNLTVMGEEAGGIEREILQAFKDTLTNPDSMMCLIGNPTTRDSAFFDCFNKDGRFWTKLRWNAEETPESDWFSYARNREIELQFGRDSDVYRISVLGEFPNVDPDCVMGDEDVIASMDRRLVMPCVRLSGVKQIGHDFARYGGDENTLYRRSGEAIVEHRVMPRVDPSEAVAEGWRMQHNAGWRDHECQYVCDAGGMGQGLMHLYHDAGKRIVEFQSNETANDTEQYANRITEAYFELAKKIKAKRFYIPYDQLLATQLSTRRYFVNKNGQLILESKDDYEKRGYDSPDRADGVVLTAYDPTITKAKTSGLMTSRHKVGQSVRIR